MVIVVVAAGIYTWAFVTTSNRKMLSSQRLDKQLHVIGLELTFAGRHAFMPPVINIFAAKPSTVLEPSTARSATADSA